VVAAKAGACLGLGGSGSVAGKVGAEQINQFVMCIAHQLKQADYKKMSGLMAKEAFATLNQIFYLVVADHRKLESFIGNEALVIEQELEKISRSIRQTGQQLIKRMEQELRSGWGWYAYMPPESRGALIKTVVDAFNQLGNTENRDLRQVAAFVINEMISTTQSAGHLENTLDRINVAMGEESGRNQGVQLINSVVAGTIFGDCIGRCETQLAKAEPLMGRPFLRNDEPEFHCAQFPLHHPGYPVA
jgi:hypothetical protein